MWRELYVFLFVFMGGGRSFRQHTDSPFGYRLVDMLTACGFNWSTCLLYDYIVDMLNVCFHAGYVFYFTFLEHSLCILHTCDLYYSRPLANTLCLHKRLQMNHNQSLLYHSLNCDIVILHQSNRCLQNKLLLKTSIEIQLEPEVRGRKFENHADIGWLMICLKHVFKK